jgi:hypothetical protein
MYIPDSASMKRSIRNWVSKIIAAISLVIVVLAVIVLQPVLLYARKTSYGRYTLLHQSELDADWKMILEKADAALRKSELYDDSLAMYVCINDGSRYPMIIGRLMGYGFAHGFHNKIVLHGNSKPGLDRCTLQDKKWKLHQLIAHEAVHCLQYKRYGLWKSRPVATIPDWKWEGYPEYIARQNENQAGLRKNIERLMGQEQEEWIKFTDGTGIPRRYYEDWILVSFCIGTKNMSFDELLKDGRGRDTLWRDMMNWYTGDNIPGR